MKLIGGARLHLNFGGEGEERQENTLNARNAVSCQDISESKSWKFFYFQYKGQSRVCRFAFTGFRVSKHKALPAPHLTLVARLQRRSRMKKTKKKKRGRVLELIVSTPDEKQEFE